ncbi:MAG: protein kinase [Myxococcota bacterium]
MSFASTESKYRRVREIAQGGMGSVELVVHRSEHFERLHALKRLHPHLRNDGEVRAMFLDEARIAGLIRHPNVVSVTDVGEDEDGPFLVMDYVEGASLASLVTRLREPPADWLSVALTILTQVADGLDAAHSLRDSHGELLGVIHRDISPHNVLIGFDGHARLTDFGIAKAAGSSAAKTQTGVLKGKLGYLAPELLRFEEATVQSDLFSFGVLLYEALTRSRLYGKDEGGPKAILNAPPPDLGEHVDVPDCVVELSLQLLSKDPALRPRSASQVAKTLRAALYELEADITPAYIGTLIASHFERPDVSIPAEATVVQTPPVARRRKLLVAGALAVLSASALWFGLRDANDAVPTSEPSVNAPRAESAEVIEPSVEPAVPPEPASAEGDNAEREGDEADPNETNTPAMAQTRRRRRTPRRARRSGSGGIAPMWDF